jgi:hypothetical protein
MNKTVQKKKSWNGKNFYQWKIIEQKRQYSRYSIFLETYKAKRMAITLSSNQEIKKLKKYGTLGSTALMC